jgi:hypothetical protein
MWRHDGPKQLSIGHRCALDTRLTYVESMIAIGGVLIETSEELHDQTRPILLDNLAGAGVLDHLVRPPCVNQQ